MKKFIPKHPGSGRERGQSLSVMVIALPAFIAAMGLATDVGALYYSYYKLQTTVDAAVLAGAHCLPTQTKCTASSTASTFATTNGVKGTDTVTGPTVDLVKNTVAMGVQRNVPYYFARLAGVTQGTVNVFAKAQAGPAGTVYDALPLGLQECNASIAACTIPYTMGTPVTFAAKKNDGTSTWVTGSGDWSALPGTATPSNTVSQCPPPAATCITSSPGFAAIKAIIDEANSLIASGNNIVAVPLVDWTGCNGACNLNVYGFAEILLTGASNNGPNNSTITGKFIAAVAPGEIDPGGGPNDVGTFAEKLIQ